MGYDASLPLVKHPELGWSLLKTAKAAVHQQFKILLLTTPGERVMDPEFGVGLRRFLFEQLNRQTTGAIESRIRKQATKYLSYVTINDISFASAHDSGKDAVVTDMDENAISITISYSFGRGFFDEITVSP